MHPPSILFPLLILAGLALASPTAEGRRPERLRPTTTATSHIRRTNTTTSVPSVAKRSDHDELDKRTPYNATLFTCTDYGCAGNCSFHVLTDGCYHTIPYLSAYVATANYTHNVLVGANCSGVLVPYMNACYNLTYPGDTLLVNSTN